ncbi:hypothetical protein EC973_000652 [Apophysomyces ossiformis]|uniref:GAT domain-containing protein n=1 Tax=Apophysomyces ossiformis TaxID=679940 RepID=A0A8H7BYS3_9FUNG|nr:hypothetical protein EC973_000652 [Apophysomyces ossiformis]
MAPTAAPNVNGTDATFSQPESKPVTEPGDELTPEELKRVRFSVGHLTTEYYPYKSSTEDEPTSDDADVLSDESASLTTTVEERHIDDTLTVTPRELYTFYENACANKEEPMLDVFTHQHLQTLTLLDLSHQNIDRRAAEPLADVLSLNFGLERLVLKDCGLEDDVNGCSLRPQQLETLASAVRKSTCLRCLSMCSNRINPQGAIWLGVMLRDYDDGENGAREYRSGLERLNLDSNDIRQGVQYIAQALRRNTSLRYLSMQDCKIDSKGCVFVGEALMMTVRQALYINRSLKELRLAATGLASEAAIGLAECLPENKSMVRLDLSKNPSLDLAGLLALSASIKINYTLTFLDVNIPPTDQDMASIQSDIAASCTRNAMLAASKTEQEAGSTETRSATDSNAMVTTAQATAHLTLQERLAAVTRSKVGSIRSSSASIESAKLPESEPRPASGEDSLIDEATIQVELLEEMLSAESKLQEDTVELLPPGDAIMQLYQQCQESHTAISLLIPGLTSTDKLANVLALNDRLTSAVQNYEQLFPPAVEASATKYSGEAKLFLDHPESEGSELPLKPSFEIGDDDEDEFEPVQNQPGPLKEQNKLEKLRHMKEMEEGVAFKQAKDAGL